MKISMSFDMEDLTNAMESLSKEANLIVNSIDGKSIDEAAANLGLNEKPLPTQLKTLEDAMTQLESKQNEQLIDQQYAIRQEIADRLGKAI